MANCSEVPSNHKLIANICFCRLGINYDLLSRKWNNVVLITVNLHLFGALTYASRNEYFFISTNSFPLNIIPQKIACEWSEFMPSFITSWFYLAQKGRILMVVWTLWSTTFVTVSNTYMLYLRVHTWWMSHLPYE